MTRQTYPPITVGNYTFTDDTSHPDYPGPLYGIKIGPPGNSRYGASFIHYQPSGNWHGYLWHFSKTGSFKIKNHIVTEHKEEVFQWAAQQLDLHAQEIEERKDP